MSVEFVDHNLLSREVYLFFVTQNVFEHKLDFARDKSVVNVSHGKRKSGIVVETLERRQLVSTDCKHSHARFCASYAARYGRYYLHFALFRQCYYRAVVESASVDAIDGIFI